MCLIRKCNNSAHSNVLCSAFILNSLELKFKIDEREKPQQKLLKNLIDKGACRSMNNVSL